MIRRLGGLVFAPVRRVVGAVRRVGRTAARLEDVVEAILVLPALSRQLELVAFQTATLPEMHAEIARLRGDTAALPTIDQRLERVAFLLERVDGNTAGVQQLADVMVPLSGAAVRVGRFADRWPARPRLGQTWEGGA